MAVASSERVDHPSAWPQRSEMLQPMDLVPGLWVERHRPASAWAAVVHCVVISYPFWHDGKLVVKLLTNTHRYTDAQIANGDFDTNYLEELDLIDVGMIPEPNGLWVRTCWLTRSPNQSSQKTT